MFRYITDLWTGHTSVGPRGFSGRALWCGPGAPFHIHYFLCIRKLLLLTFFNLVFSCSPRHVFLHTGRNTCSGFHPQKSWACCSFSCLQSPWPSSKMRPQEQNELHVHERVDCPASMEAAPALMTDASSRVSKTSLSWPGYELCDPTGSFPLAQPTHAAMFSEGIV